MVIFIIPNIFYRFWQAKIVLNVTETCETNHDVTDRTLTTFFEFYWTILTFETGLIRLICPNTYRRTIFLPAHSEADGRWQKDIPNTVLEMPAQVGVAAW